MTRIFVATNPIVYARAMPADLHQTWRSIGVESEDVDAAPDGTIRVLPRGSDRPPGFPETRDSNRPPAFATDEAVAVQVPAERPQLPPRALESFSSIRDTGLNLQVSEVLLGATLGEGGMGRVWRGYQRSLEREVAVKGLRENVDSAQMRKQLLREARVTGALEHPNVIPVHVLVKDERGGPLMVMKRVEGRPWGEQMAESRGKDGQLEANLRVLVQVCHAVHFAHSRGVLHRDLKPDNVMVGPYGEVYVLDWGIAVAIRDDSSVPGLSLARNSHGIVGTLQYMSPEMVGGDGALLDVRSDVYLLGAILHEVLTGQPRHHGDSIPQLVHNVWVSRPPEYGPEVPSDLAALATRATHADKDQRPASAEAFRQAIEAWLEHRVSHRLTEAAKVQLAEAKARRARGENPDPAMRESRFGFRQALRSWEDNPAAAAGLQESLTMLLDVAIEAESIDTARAVLSEMDTPNARHNAPRVEALASHVETKTRRLAQLENVAAEMDLGQASRKRRVFGVGFGLTFALVNVALELWSHAHPLAHGSYLLVTGITAAVWALPAMIVRRTIFPNRASRRLGWSLALLLFGQALSFAVMWKLEIAFRPALALSLFPLATVILVKAVLIDMRMLWSAILALVGGAVAVFFPATALYVVGAVYAAFFCGGALLSYEHSMDPDALGR